MKYNKKRLYGLIVIVAILTGVVTLGFGSGVTAVEAAQTDQDEVIGEVGVTTFEQPDRETLFTVDLQETYDNPVVIMKPVGPAGGQPAHIRLRNVQSGSFEYQIEEWSSNGGHHAEVRVSYMVIESGQHTLDGQSIEAGTVQANHENTTIDVASDFSGAPVAFTQSQTRNGGDYIVTRNRVGDGSQILTRLQEEENADGEHAFETVGYVLFEQGTGADDSVPFEVGRTAPTVTEQSQQIDFSQSFAQTPRFIADMQTTNGQDTAQVRLSSLNTAGASVFIEEETTADSETRHPGSESVGYLAIGDAGTLRIEDTSTAEAAFGINSVNSRESVTEGNSVTYSVDISNEGDAAGTETVSVEIPGVGTTDVSVSLASGQSRTVELSVPTSSGDAGTYDATVRTSSDSLSRSVTIEAAASNNYCQPGNEEPQMQAVQLHVDDAEIEQGDPGRISGSIASDITNNCPVKVQLTLEVPSGVRIEGGTDIQSGSGGLVTSTFVVEPGEAKGISADVYGTTPGLKRVQSSITYYPVNHSDRAKQADTNTLRFTVVDDTELSDDSSAGVDDSDPEGSDDADTGTDDPGATDSSGDNDGEPTVSVEIPGFTSVTAVIAFVSVIAIVRRRT